MAGKPSTLSDVARLAGVSIMTASRALRNQGNVATETLLRVKSAAKKIDYRPNPLVSALMAYRRKPTVQPGVTVIAMITNFPSRNGWKEAPINVEFHAGALEACEQRGYRLETFWLREPGMTARRLSNILFHRNIGGLLIAPLPSSRGHMRLEWEKFASVALGYSLAWPALHRAVNHQFRSMQLALRKLRKLGYRRPGLALKASYDQRSDHNFVGSFLLEQQREEHDHLPVHVPPDKEWNFDSFQRWVRRSRPEAIITQHEEVLDWLHTMKLNVPSDMGVVHLNCPIGDPQWSGIIQNASAVGALAIEHIVAMLQRNERGIPRLPHYLLVEGSWRDGETIRTDALKRKEGRATLRRQLVAVR